MTDRRLDSMEHWMNLALEEARIAAREDEVPVGAVAVSEGELLARDHNRSIQLHDPTAHAEQLVLRQAGQKLSNYRLNHVDLYVTLEPCAMCAGALLWARVKQLVFGVRDEKAGAVFSRVSLLSTGLFNHHIQVVEGILADPSRDILQQFFSRLR
ncbi:MAG: tRNA adenosine(34) deaminase TadA [Acidobacteriota bacterium]|nr:tRNA adenosine(34) deaminase TadA [Acidobacteriota bacterium]